MRLAQAGKPVDPVAVTSAVNILLVDDHAANLMALDAILRPLGHRLVHARSGEEAFRHLLKETFALILLDVQMPGIDGFKTAALIKTRERTQHIPIIFLTAINTDPSYVAKGYEHGAVDYLLKPFDPEILKSKVAVFVALHLQRERIRQQATQLHAREREALERRSNWRYRKLIDAMSPCMWAVLPNGKIYYANKAWLAYSGRTEAEDATTSYFESVHEDERPRLEQAWGEARQSGQPFQLQFRLKRHDGVYRWHLGRAVPELDELGQIVALDRHRYRHRRSEARRRRAESSALRARDEFFSIASHELRTPLTSLQLTVQALLLNARRDNDQGFSGAEAKEFLLKVKRVEQQVMRQAKLVEDLLDVSRIAAGTIVPDWEQVDLCAVARDVAARFTDSLANSGCALSIEAPAQLVWRTDRMRVDQVLTNLLSNAIKYGGDHPIVLQVEQVGDRAVLRVADRGIGIAAGDRERIFGRFTRAVAEKAYSGFGLGLWISHRIVEALGGVIRVESEMGNGSTFSVELPEERPVTSWRSLVLRKRLMDRSPACSCRRRRRRARMARRHLEERGLFGGHRAPWRGRHRLSPASPPALTADPARSDDAGDGRRPFPQVAAVNLRRCPRSRPCCCRRRAKPRRPRRAWACTAASPSPSISKTCSR